MDRSVFILAENRLNLQPVFNELEKLYLEPQIELHEARFIDTVTTRGAQETFRDAGTIVLTNKDVPWGEMHERQRWEMVAEEGVALEAMRAATPALAPTPAPAATGVVLSAPEGLTKVQRVRQFFPGDVDMAGRLHWSGRHCRRAG